MADLASLEVTLWFRSRKRLDDTSVPSLTSSITDPVARTFVVDITKDDVSTLPSGRTSWLEVAIVDVNGVQTTFGPVNLTVVDGAASTIPAGSIGVHRGSDLTLSGVLTDTELTISGVTGAQVLPVLSVGLKGDKGDPGLVFRGDYSTQTTYHRDDVVTFEGSAWVALDTSTSIVPGSDDAIWALLASKGDGGGLPTRTYVIFASGQSNMVQKPAHVWAEAPPSNLHIWNWDGTESGIGTAYTAASATIVSLSRWYGALRAWLNPDEDVYVINIAWGGMPIHHWIGGLGYVYDASTTIGDPGVGKLRLNSSTPGSVTEMAMSVTDAAGVVQFGASFPAATRLRIAKASDPSVYIQVDPGTGTWNTFWFDVPVTFTSSAGTLANGDAVKVTIDPDIQQIIRNNLPPALAAAGATKVDEWLWWQGESDPFVGSAYTGYFETLNAWLISDGFLDYDTPTVIWGTSTYVIGDTQGVWFKTNKPLQRVVHGKPDTRTFVYTSSIPASFWEYLLSIGLHMTAEGYIRAASLGYEARNGGTARKTIFGAIYDPWTGALEFNKGSSLAPAMQFDGVNGGWWSPRADNISYGVGGVEGFTLGQNGFGFGIGANPSNVFETKRTGTGASTNVAVWKNSGEYITQVVQQQSSADNLPPQWVTYKSRGTLASPAAVQLNDFGLLRDAQMRGSSAWVFAFREQLKVIEATPDDTHMGMQWSIAFPDSGSASAVQKLSVDSVNGLSLLARVVIDPNGIFRTKSYAVASLPSAAPPGQIITISDRSYRPATSDGFNWHFGDGTLVA
jgi:hypothetical protein